MKAVGTLDVPSFISIMEVIMLNRISRSIAAFCIVATFAAQPIFAENKKPGLFRQALSLAGRAAQFSCTMVGKTVKSFPRLVGVGIALYPIVKPTGLLDPQNQSEGSIVEAFGGRMAITAASELATISAACMLAKSPRALPINIATAYIANKAVNYAEKNQYQIPTTHITDSRLKTAIGHVGTYAHKNIFTLTTSDMIPTDSRTAFVSSAAWQQWAKLNTNAATTAHAQLTKAGCMAQKQLGNLCELVQK